MAESRAHTPAFARILPAPLFRSMRRAPLEPDTLRWAGELLLVGSAISWAFLALAMLIAQLNGSGALPVLESAIGTVLLFSFWRFYPRQLTAATPILLQATVVFTFIAFTVSYDNAVPLAGVWIVAWACCAASVLTLALGLANAILLVIGGSVVLNLVMGWAHPNAPSPALASTIGASAAAVVAFITHCVCFQLTRAHSETKQLERFRGEMFNAFAAELSIPRSALGQIAFRTDVNGRTSAELGLVNDQLHTLSDFLLDRGSSRLGDPGARDLTTLEDIMTIASSMARRVAVDHEIQINLQGASGDTRFLLFPARLAVFVISYLIRAAVLRPGTRSLQLASQVDEKEDGSLEAWVSLRVDEKGQGASAASTGNVTTGLTTAGLQSLLRQVGGRLALGARGDHWQTADVRFPGSISELGDNTTPADKAHSGFSLEGLDILLIEDDELTRLLTARNMERSGARVHQVENAAAAAQALDTQPFDLVVADLNLPDQSGDAMIARLRARNNTVPIIVASALSGAADLPALVLAGADQLLGKPLQNEQVQLSVALFRASGRIRS